MSTDLKIAKNPYNEQIMRLSALQKFPLYPQGVTELREALKKHSGTLDRATQVIDKIMGERETCPSPKELVFICGEVIRAAEAVPGGCEICGGGLWITIQRRVKDPSGVEYMADGAARCECSKGQWLRQKDQENAAKRKAGLAV